MANRPVTEDELHAYVDGALDNERRRELDDYLSRHPEVGARVEGYRRQREALRAVLRPIADEPVPPELSFARMIEARRRPRAAWWRQAAAAAVLLVLGGGGGWVLRSASEPPVRGLGALAQEASQTFAVFQPDRNRPVEIRADHEDDLVKWLSNRLGRPMPVPDLTASGYRLMGGRLVATPHGPAGLLMYDDDQGHRIAMLTRPMEEVADADIADRQRDGVARVTWATRGMGYSLVGATSDTALAGLAREMRRQIDKA